VPLIDAQGLTKRFGPRTAVDHVDLRIPSGVCFGFLGPNGAGKTTMIRLLLGLARADAGSVQIAGIDVAVDPARALAGVGAIVEEPRFHPHLTGAENLRVHAPLVGDGAEDRIPELLGRVGLQDRGEDKVKGYSMGMRQRLGVARALLGDPRLLILDEPTNGLDAEGMAEFRTLIRGMVEQEGRTVFLSSHLLDEMQKLCDEVAFVEEGRIITQTSVKELLRGADGAARLLLLDVDDRVRAREVLAGLVAVSAVEETGDPDHAPLLAVTLAGGREAAMAVTRALVQADVGVAEVRPESVSLERRYFDVMGGGS